MTKSLFELFCEPSGPAPQNLLTRDTLHFVEQLPFGALLADAQGHIAFGNSRAGQLLGTSTKKRFSASKRRCCGTGSNVIRV